MYVWRRRTCITGYKMEVKISLSSGTKKRFRRIFHPDYFSTSQRCVRVSVRMWNKTSHGTSSLFPHLSHSQKTVPTIFLPPSPAKKTFFNNFFWRLSLAEPRKHFSVAAHFPSRRRERGRPCIEIDTRGESVRKSCPLLLLSTLVFSICFRGKNGINIAFSFSDFHFSHHYYSCFFLVLFTYFLKKTWNNTQMKGGL